MPSGNSRWTGSKNPDIKSVDRIIPEKEKNNEARNSVKAAETAMPEPHNFVSQRILHTI